MINPKFEELKHARDLPSPSGIGLAILRLTQTPDHSLEDLSRCIQADPALTGRLLKAANSFHRAGLEPVNTVAQAAARLGVPAVRSVALGFTLVSAHRAGGCEEFDYERYWSKSLACALAASALSRRVGAVDPGEAFTCGLLSQIGMLALASVHADSYGHILDESAGKPLLELLAAETRAYRIHHIEVAVAMMTEWGVSRAMTGALTLWAAQSDAEIDDPAQRPLARILDVSARLAELLLSDWPRESAEFAAAWAPLCASARRLDLDPHAVLEVCGRVSREWQEWGERFRIATRTNAGLTDDASSPDVAQFSPIGTVATESATMPSGSIALARQDVRSTRRDPIRVLIVDDDARLLRLVSLHLERAGYHVSTAENGKSGLDAAMQHRPDIIVTDWAMPELSGLEMCKALRRNQSGHRAYVLLLTAREEEEDRIVDAFDAGIDDYITKPFNARILLARVQAGQRLIELQRRVDADKYVRLKQVSEMGLLTRRLRAAALTDILTELPNRRFAVQRLDQEWRASVQMNRPLSVVMIDIDHFKAVNDTYGHAVGDKVLQATSDVLRQRTRRGDIVCRWGGEEFLVINVNSDIEGARKCAERLRSAVAENEIFCEGFRGRVTVSLGLAERSASSADVDMLIKSADWAVYDAKAAGRNTIREGPTDALSESA